MTKAEYKKIKDIEADKWLGTICFISASINFMGAVVRFIENGSFWWPIIGFIFWTIAGILRIVSYKKDMKFIDFEEEK